MMHAADDWFIPIHASRELFEISKQRPKNFPPVNYLEFEKEKSFGHFLIYQNQEIYSIVKYLFVFILVFILLILNIFQFTESL